MNQYKKTTFLKLALQFLIGFFIFVTILRLFTGFFKFEGIEGAKQAYLYDGNWKPFLQSQVLFSLLYGLFMAGYYKFIKK